MTPASVASLPSRYVAVGNLSESEQRELRRVIRARMKERGWRPAELARRTGISEAHVGRVLKGTRSLTDEVLAVIADALRVTAALLKAEAGVLDEDELRRLDAREPFEVYIAGDPWLSEEAKANLTGIYRDLVRASQEAARGRPAPRRAD